MAASTARSSTASSSTASSSTASSSSARSTSSESPPPASPLSREPAPREIELLVDAQRKYFGTGATRDLKFRIERLRRLRETIVRNEAALFEVLKADLNKPGLEAYTAEVGFIVGEIDHTIKHLKRWARSRTVLPPPVLLPAMGELRYDPKGVVLIIGAWNYPFQLTISPLIPAIAAGNCAIVKPSELSEKSSLLVARLLGEAFDPAHVTVVEGGAGATQALLEHRFDHVFFTGSTTVGRIVMQAAARHLSPVTLELGGKSPCVVDGSANFPVAARRIAWGKFMNAGQTCIAPDYLLVTPDAREPLLTSLQQTIAEFYGADPEQSPDYARVINSRHFERLKGLLGMGRIVLGGQTNPDTRYIAPTLLEDVPLDSRLMQDEIFGPLLPIVLVDDISAAIRFINDRPKPLAMYVFSELSAVSQRIFSETSAGGGCVNDCVVQVSAPELPFGGVGDSGMGAYHGRAGFETFSHLKSVVKNTSKLDVKLRYPPYGDNLKILRRLL